MGNRAILKRKYYAVKLELASPMCVSNGDDYYTDSDVMTNGSGQVFIPGTSIAGAFRNRLNQKKEEAGLMGFSQGEDGNMSSLFISDLYFQNTDQIRIEVRDGVKLTEDKTVKNKFDMQVIETGAIATLHFYYNVRTGDDQESWESDIRTILCEIQNGGIRFGSNKNRGFGRMQILSVAESEFGFEKLEQWLSFRPGPDDLSSYQKKYDSFEEWKAAVQIKDEMELSNYIKISVPLKLTGGISIRKYCMEPGKADYEQLTIKRITENQKEMLPVIPGSSWMGAIRADIRNILRELQSSCDMTMKKSVQEIMDDWFGYVDEEKKTARQSNLVVGESIIRDSKPQLMTRNQINRFDASTKSGALYTEVSYFGGETELELWIRKQENGSDYAMIGLLDLVIQDIMGGYVAVGGQTAVGRGIFALSDYKKYEPDKVVDMKECRQALYQQLFRTDCR